MIKTFYCKKCVYPSHSVNISFDEKGVCNICRQIEYKKDNINWDDKAKDFEKILEIYRGKHAYDCIVPFSGGKDSSYTLYYLMKEYNIKPLVVRFNHGFLRKNM